jgi:hypothetical protein
MTSGPNTHTFRAMMQNWQDRLVAVERRLARTGSGITHIESGSGIGVDGVGSASDPIVISGAGRLGPQGQQTSDWNLAVESGWYWSNTGGTINAPPTEANGSSDWMSGEVFAHGGGTLTQEVTCVRNNTSFRRWAKWRRYRAVDGSWSSWQRTHEPVTLSGAGTDIRYVRVAVIDGYNSTNGASAQIEWFGGHNIGTTQAYRATVDIWQRGDNNISVTLNESGWTGTTTSPIWYTRQISTYVFELWVKTPAFRAIADVRLQSYHYTGVTSIHLPLYMDVDQAAVPSSLVQVLTTDMPWTTLTAAAGWSSNSLAYRIKGGMVEIRGEIWGGTDSTTAFTMPIGARPSARRSAMAPRIGSTGTAFGIIHMQASGVATFTNSGASAILTASPGYGISSIGGYSVWT